ncbi:MAG: EAL domain-containing protein [Actinomycetota bacterium]|nr:EAL domain-containing protein [Actinomycetota bacterium]
MDRLKATPSAADVDAVTGSTLSTLLPSGRLLTDGEWRSRHRVLVAVLALHVPVVAALHAAEGLAHGLAEAGALAAVPALAAVARLPRVARESLVGSGLMLAAALVVHGSDGNPTTHFHFFALLALLTAYQRWLPFLLAVGVVFAHHLVVGVTVPAVVFGPQAGESPLRLSLTHAGYLVLAAASAMWVWRVTSLAHDRVHAQAVRLAEELDGALGATDEAVVTMAPDGTCGYVSSAAATLLGQDAATLAGRAAHDAFHAPLASTTGECTMCAAVSSGAQVRVQDRVRRADGQLVDVDVSVCPHAGRPGAALVLHPHTGACPKDLALLGDLRRALGRDELVLHYQPRVSLVDGTCSGFEALVRWHHPEHGLLPPVRFVPLAEDHGLVPDLDAWVLRAAVAQAARWVAGDRRITVAVNLSARSLGDLTLPERVRDVLVGAGVDASVLEVEVTETAVMENSGTARRVLDELRALGVAVAIDDFGVGYASLTYLRDLPADVVKIDRSFVSRVVDDPASRAIVGATVGLAHALGKSVVAEGIEDEASATVLVELGVRVAQGYLYGRPVPAADLDLDLELDLTGEALLRH